MDNVIIVFVIACLIFVIGFDFSSYNIMKKIDPFYKKRNKFFVGYNTFKVWQSYREAEKNSEENI